MLINRKIISDLKNMATKTFAKSRDKIIFLSFQKMLYRLKVKREIIELDEAAKEEYEKMRFLFLGKEMPMAINKVGNKYKLIVPDFYSIIDVTGLPKDKSFLMHMLIQRYQGKKSDKRDFNELLAELESEVFAGVSDKGITNSIKENIRMMRPENIEAFIAKNHCHYNDAFANRLSGDYQIIHTHGRASNILSSLDKLTGHGLINELPTGKYELFTSRKTSKTPWKMMDAKPENKQELHAIHETYEAELNDAYDNSGMGTLNVKSDDYKEKLSEFNEDKKTDIDNLFKDAIKNNDLEKIHLANIKHKQLSNFIAKKYLEGSFLQKIDDSIMDKFEIIVFGRIGSGNPKIAGYISDYDVKFICTDVETKKSIKRLLESGILKDDLNLFNILLEITDYTVQTKGEIFNLIETQDEKEMNFFCSIYNSYVSLNIEENKNNMAISIFNKIDEFLDRNQIDESLYQETISENTSKNSFKKILLTNSKYIGYQGLSKEDLVSKNKWCYSLKYQLLRFCDFANNVNLEKCKKNVDLTKYEKFGILLQTINAKILEEKKGYTIDELLDENELINDITSETFLKLVKDIDYGKIILSAIDELLITDLLIYDFDNLTDELIVEMGFYLFGFINDQMLKNEKLIKKYLAEKNK